MGRSSDSQVRSIRQDRTRIVILILTSLLAGCISTGGYIKGQVLDADTGEPISNANVAIIWEGDAFAFVETQSVDMRADVTLTDANGKFRFWPWVQWDGILPLSDVHYSNIIVYKTGYFDMRYYDLLHKNTIRGRIGEPHLLRRYEKGDISRREYMDYLLQVSSWASCGTDQANLVPIKRAVYTEAERFAKTNDEKEIADTILSGPESYEFGYDEADKRRHARESAKERRLWNNPAYRALKSGELADLEYVIQTGLSTPNDRLENGDTLLVTAADNGNALMVAYLVNSGADPAALGYTEASLPTLDLGIGGTRGGTALSRTVGRLFDGHFEDPTGYIAIVSMLSAAKGVDLTQLRELKSSRDPKIRALADITPEKMNKAPELSKAPVERLDIFSKPIELKTDKEIYLQFEIKDGKIMNVGEVPGVPLSGELLALQFRDGAKTGRQSVALRTRMHGKVYMRVVQEGGDQCAHPIQSYLVGTPPYDEMHSWALDPSCNKVSVTDFYLHNWPNEQPVQPSLSIDVGSPGQVNSTPSTVGSNRAGREGVSRTK
jgi:hypothetical protein